MAAAGSCRTTLLALLAALAGWIAVPARADDPEPRPSLDATAALRASQAAVGRQLDDFTLLDRDGRPVRLSDYRGKPLLVNFIYTGCFQVCPTSTRALAEALRAMSGSFDASQYNVVSIGFNQPADSPQAMKAFALQQRVSAPNWDFLSAPAPSVAALTQAFGFVYVPTQAGFDHLLQVGIVDARGRLVAQVYGDDFRADQLGTPLRRLLAEQPLTAQASLADIVDRVRVLCSVYDPVTGTYRVSYALAIEVAGGVTFVVAMLWLLAAEWRQRRRLRRVAR